jgi:hypothetical protein
MIETFYNTTYTQVRRTTSSPTTTDAITTVSTFVGVRRPVMEKSKLFVENNIGKEFNIYCDDGNSVNVGDDLYEDGTLELNVLGVTDYTDLEDDCDSHLSIRVSSNV